ncbi:hypothetical protein AWB75_07080 [Caballeronia catudaia]|uniref:Uncharacterized protein n=1 Tax=Caballeronia catudaia TaxID=1777136 RepID=A0A158DSH1_9BURK|nr:hypothetical protein [Caballeronia catudaia]SAK97106.1 hypothetical protein AWB75_07080 [Caballeronia catudaia]
MNAPAMPNVTAEMVEFVARYRLPERVLADFDRWFETRKALGADPWKSFVSYANQYAG